MFSHLQPLKAIYSHLHPLNSFTTIYSYVQVFPAISSHLQPITSMQCNKKQFKAIFCQFQPFEAIYSQFQAFSYFQQFPAIYSHLQLCPAIYSNWQALSGIYSRIAPFLGVSFLTFTVFCQYFWRTLGCNILQVWGIRDQGSGIRDQGSGNRDQGTGIREQGSGNREQETVLAGSQVVHLHPYRCVMTGWLPLWAKIICWCHSATGCAVWILTIFILVIVFLGKLNVLGLVQISKIIKEMIFQSIGPLGRCFL